VDKARYESEGRSDDGHVGGHSNSFLGSGSSKGIRIRMTIGEREKARVRCPKCKGTNVVPQLGGFMAQTSKKS
jgi:hypothetical protein